MAISRRTMALSALIASVWGGVERSAEAQDQRLPMRVVVYDYTDSEPAILQQAQRAVTRIFGEIDTSGSFAVAQNAAPEQEVVPATGGARAWAHGQSLPVSDPREILASDPAAFIQLLDDFRPSPVTSETKQMVLKSLPLELKGRAVNARDRAKLEGLYPVLRAVQRDAVYEIRVIQSPSATIAIDSRAVLLISERALGVLDADQLRAAVAHEAAHEYVWEEWQRADKRDDWKRLRELELVCDGIAVVILQQLGLETSSLIRGFEKLTYLNLLWLGSPPIRAGIQRWPNAASSPRRWRRG